MNAPELSKPQGNRCKHFCGTGCSIYSQRPKVCQDYECVYVSLRRQVTLPYKFRPDQLGALPSAEERPGGGTFIAGYKLEPGSARTAETLDFIDVVALDYVVAVTCMDGPVRRYWCNDEVLRSNSEASRPALFSLLPIACGQQELDWGGAEAAFEVTR